MFDSFVLGFSSFNLKRILLASYLREIFNEWTGKDTERTLQIGSDCPTDRTCKTDREQTPSQRTVAGMDRGWKCGTVPIIICPTFGTLPRSPGMWAFDVLSNNSSLKSERSSTGPVLGSGPLAKVWTLEGGSGFGSEHPGVFWRSWERCFEKNLTSVQLPRKSHNNPSPCQKGRWER